nr:MAG TPA: hypothetical protein [Caudoviricetes sp.]
MPTNTRLLPDGRRIGILYPSRFYIVSLSRYIACLYYTSYLYGCQ